ncbi:MAG: nucleotidyltransferase domain-containing protein, partial [Promethearchaeota archaeon]
MNDDMLQINQIAEILAENVPEVDLVILFGSFAHGFGHELSDYDIIAICDSKRVVWEFMLNERPVQVWSMTWKYAEEVITGQSGYWSTNAGSLAEGIIIWEKSSELHERFERIISKVKQGGRAVVNQTLNFDDLFSRLWLIEKSIRTGKDTNIRLLVWDLAIGICHRLAGLNNQYYLRNWG